MANKTKTFLVRFFKIIKGPISSSISSRMAMTLQTLLINQLFLLRHEYLWLQKFQNLSSLQSQGTKFFFHLQLLPTHFIF